MARKKEFIKKSEARILIYLSSVANFRKCGSYIAKKLKIDYIYVMKLMEKMWEKGWIRTHKYDQVTYFDLTKVSPMKEAQKRLATPQLKLGAE